MNCSCRTAALRIFVRSVVRIHNPPIALSRAIRPCQTFSRQPRGGARHGAELTYRPSYRQLSTSSPNRTEVPATAEEPRVAESQSGQVSPSEAEPSQAKPKKRTLREKKAEQRALLRAARDKEPLEGSTEISESGWRDPKEEVAKPTTVKEHDVKARMLKGQDGKPRMLKGQDGKPRPSREAEVKPKTSEGKKIRQRTVKTSSETVVKAEHGRATPKDLRNFREFREPADKSKDPSRRREDWMEQKAALKEKFPEGWSPRKKLSPDALAGIRALHTQFPEEYTTEVLANKFEVSIEAIRRILKSKWEPSPDEEIERQERWFNRGKRIWSAWADDGKKPPKKWREEGITRTPEFHEQRRTRANARRNLAKTLV